MAGVGFVDPVLFLGLVVWWPWWVCCPCGVRRGHHESYTLNSGKGYQICADEMCVGVVLTCVGSVRLGLSLPSCVLSWDAGCCLFDVPLFIEVS